MTSCGAAHDVDTTVTQDDLAVTTPSAHFQGGSAHNPSPPQSTFFAKSSNDPPKLHSTLFAHSSHNLESTMLDPINNNSPASPHIIKLPVEVLDIIFAKCENEDLPNLRLTCKTTCHTSTQLFGLASFTHRRFLFPEYSLQGLFDLTAHATFAPCIRSINFGTSRLGEADAGSEHRLREERNALAQKHAAFIRAGSHHIMLEQAFRNLKICRNTKVKVGIYDDLWSTHLTWLEPEDLLLMGPEDACKYSYTGGYSAAESYDRFIVRHFDAENTLAAIFDASKSAGFALTSLDLDMSIEWLSKIDHPRRCLTPDAAFKKVCVTDSGRLNPDVDVCFTHRISNSFALNRFNTAYFRTTSRSTRLELFNQQFGDRDEPGTPFDDFHYGELLNVIEQTPFKKLVIHHSDVRPDYFRETFGSMKHSLKHLELSDIYLFKDDHSPSTIIWPFAFFEYLKDEMALESLVLKDLRFVDEWWSNYRMSFKEEKKWSGNREVYLALQGLVHDLKTQGPSPYQR